MPLSRAYHPQFTCAPQWLLLWLVAARVHSAGAIPASPVQLAHSIVLDPDVTVHWTPDNDTNTITFRVEARTRGWVAIGFSPTGGMTGADIVIAWVTDGRAHIQDMHAVGNAPPLPDARSDVHLLDGWQNGSHTVITFRRPLRSCDTQHDLDVGVGTSRLIWALHPSDPSDRTGAAYHGPRRGVRSVSLDGSGTFQFPADSESFVIRNTETEVITHHTHYHCEIHKLPDLGAHKVHYTGFRVRLDPSTAAYVHHMNLMACYVPESKLSSFEAYADSHPGTRCYTPNMPPSWGLCQSVMVAWSIGSEGDMLPDNVGMPLGAEHGGATYFMLETHYDNPQIHSGMRDSSGLELFFTRTLRPVEAGLIEIGHAISSTMLIPPRQRTFTSGGVCSRQCTEKHLPSAGVEVHSVMVHAHLAARSVRVRHVRKGTELPPLIVDELYDFNYQQSRRVDGSMRILPGDDLIVECDYDTRDRDNITMGGLTSKTEMCIAFIIYFPRAPLPHRCTSQPHVGDFLREMDVQSVEVDGLTMPVTSGVDYWMINSFRKQTEQLTETLIGNISEEIEHKFSDFAGDENDVGQLDAGLTDILVSTDSQTTPVTLREYMEKLSWDELDVSRLQRMANGGRLFYQCRPDGHRALEDYKNMNSGPHRYPEFKPWASDEKICAS